MNFLLKNDNDPFENFFKENEDEVESGCDGYVFVSHYDTDAVDGNNWHIFPAKRNRNGSWDVSTRADSCCGRFKATRYNFPARNGRKLEDNVRLLAAKLQNKGYEICGQCVATFYKG